MTDNRVGILGIEVYFPSTYVSQVDMEKANEVSAGKYTIGLGQTSMAFTGDREDINSICLTAVHSLLEKYSISSHEVGRLEVGTETLVDKSKSTKTVLMGLFPGNTDIEGATVVNACYGGTAALLNALAWTDSSAWDGRFAIVVAGDIAVYADGPARPTGGCGAVALLVGRNAPLAIDLRSRTTHATHVWDFFKPKLTSEYPEVNGALSQTCYLRAFDDCYSRFVQKQKALYGVDVSVEAGDLYLFHSPYNKLVQKSFARMIFQDMLIGSRPAGEDLVPFLTMPAEKTYEDRTLEAKLKDVAGALYKAKVAPCCEVSKQIGNTYTASVYMNLANMISQYGDSLVGKRVVLFSYGSGALASMFAISPTDVSPDLLPSKFSLASMQEKLGIPARLASREQLTPAHLTEALNAREAAHGHAPFTPAFLVDKMFPGTYYLDHITAGYERVYTRKPIDSAQVLGGPQLPPPPAPLVQPPEPPAFDTDDFVDIANVASLSLDSESSLLPAVAGGLLPRTKLTRNQTFVWASGRPNVRVVVTGVAAALPGLPKLTFVDEHGVVQGNGMRIIRGENFIAPIAPNVIDAMLEKNVVQLIKGSDGTTKQHTLQSHEESIKLCAPIGDVDLVEYGISQSIISTMDKAVQVSIACGLEALKDAGLVSGQGENGWVLPTSMQETTGVVYATSFPALDTAITEVTKYFQTKTVAAESTKFIMDALRQRLIQATGPLSEASERALAELEALAHSAAANSSQAPQPLYEFDRKFLFRVLVLGNAQLAQIIKARGPNMQTNAACAGSTQAVAVAFDMIQVGRAERMLVIAGDNASSNNLLPWLGNGFRALGAATTCGQVDLASLPFDKRRSGMILGSGGIGLVLESEEGAIRRFRLASAAGLQQPASLARSGPFRCRLLGTLFSNSAYHGASMDRAHIAAEMERFISSIEKEHGIARAEIAKFGVYFSHETQTHASASSSCAANEVFGLRQVFGESLKDLLILNTKGYTGHPMGVSFEDVVAAEVLVNKVVPPIANNAQLDPALGDLKLSRGGPYFCKYALRFAAGFGSQIALALYGSADT